MHLLGAAHHAPTRARFILPPFFFFNDTATTEIYTLSLHDALPIYKRRPKPSAGGGTGHRAASQRRHRERSEEHTSELQSPNNLVCRLLLEERDADALGRHAGGGRRTGLHLLDNHSSAGPGPGCRCSAAPPRR